MQETQETGLIHGAGISPGVGSGNPLQYSCLENSTDRGVWRAIIYGFTKSQTQLSTYKTGEKNLKKKKKKHMCMYM